MGWRDQGAKGCGDLSIYHVAAEQNAERAISEVLKRQESSLQMHGISLIIKAQYLELCLDIAFELENSELVLPYFKDNFLKKKSVLKTRI